MGGDLVNALAATLHEVLGTVKIEGLRQLSAGASRETWSFEAFAPDESHGLILQRSGEAADLFKSGLDEAAVTRHALAGGLRVPKIPVADSSESSIGALCTISRRIKGVSIPCKVLGDETRAAARRGSVADSRGTGAPNRRRR